MPRNAFFHSGLHGVGATGCRGSPPDTGRRSPSAIMGQLTPRGVRGIYLPAAGWLHGGDQADEGFAMASSESSSSPSRPWRTNSSTPVPPREITASRRIRLRVPRSRTTREWPPRRRGPPSSASYRIWARVRFPCNRNPTVHLVAVEVALDARSFGPVTDEVDRQLQVLWRLRWTRAEPQELEWTFAGSQAHDGHQSHLLRLQARSGRRPQSSASIPFGTIATRARPASNRCGDCAAAALTADHVTGQLPIR